MACFVETSNLFYFCIYNLHQRFGHPDELGDD